MYVNVKEELQFYNALRQKIPAGNLCEYQTLLFTHIINQCVKVLQQIFQVNSIAWRASH